MNLQNVCLQAFCLKVNNIKKLLTANSQVTEEEPPADQWFLWVPGWFIHDVQIGGVEPQCSGRQAVCHQIDPEQLDRD